MRMIDLMERNVPTHDRTKELVARIEEHKVLLTSKREIITNLEAEINELKKELSGKEYDYKYLASTLLTAFKIKDDENEGLVIVYRNELEKERAKTRRLLREIEQLQDK